jgi:hypothetical protein
MAFSTKSETTKEKFKDRCNMAEHFATMPDIQITENGVAKLLHQGYRTAVYGIKHFSFFKDKTNKCGLPCLTHHQYHRIS